MKYAIALIATCLLASCSNQTTESTATTSNSDFCVAGYVEDEPGAGTLDIYFDTEFADKVQSITGVSVEVADEVTNFLGRC
jgi:hypothetical protein